MYQAFCTIYNNTIFFLFISNREKSMIKKRHLDSHRSTVTTQTQNKTRQNYYAIFLLCRGGILLTHIYSHTYK